MITRIVTANDISKIKEMWEKHYKDSFSFPNFSKFILTILVEDEMGRIVSVCGVKPIIECVMLTNKDFSANKRWSAITEIVKSSEGILKENNIDELHAFVKDYTWEQHLEKLGFVKATGRALVKQI